MPSNYDDIDLRFTWNGDFVLKNGDLGDNSEDALLSLMDQIHDICASSYAGALSAIGYDAAKSFDGDVLDCQPESNTAILSIPGESDRLLSVIDQRVTFDPVLPPGTNAVLSFSCEVQP